MSQPSAGLASVRTGVPPPVSTSKAARGAWGDGSSVTRLGVQLSAPTAGASQPLLIGVLGDPNPLASLGAYIYVYIPTHRHKYMIENKIQLLRKPCVVVCPL